MIWMTPGMRPSSGSKNRKSLSGRPLFSRIIGAFFVSAPVLDSSPFVLNLPTMIKAYFRKLVFLWRHPVDFFSTAALESKPQEASTFAAMTAVLVSLELGLQEALSRGTLSIVAFVTLMLLIGLPFAVLVCGYLWAYFIRLTGILLGADLYLPDLQKLVFYSSGGLAALGVAYLLGKWVAIAALFFQVVGAEKVLACSRVSAYVYILLPAAMMGVLMAVLALLFKVF